MGALLHLGYAREHVYQVLESIKQAAIHGGENLTAETLIRSGLKILHSGGVVPI